MNFLKDKIFLEKKNKQQHYFFSVKGEWLTLSWETVVNCLNFNIVNNLFVKELPNYGLVLHNYNNISIIKEILKEFSLLDVSASNSAHLYISFTEISNTFGRHKDTSDVLFWQSIGSTKWIIEEDNKFFTYILKPNDFIYVPKNMYHTVVPLTPRVGVSFGLDY
jgi:ribosomal protein L16 Arg81 hydroxylase